MATLRGDAGAWLVSGRNAGASRRAIAATWKSSGVHARKTLSALPSPRQRTVSKRSEPALTRGARLGAVSYPRHLVTRLRWLRSGCTAARTSARSREMRLHTFTRGDSESSLNRLSSCWVSSGIAVDSEGLDIKGIAVPMQPKSPPMPGGAPH